MVNSISSSWRGHIPVVLPRPCMRHLPPKPPKLQRCLHHTATLTRAGQRLMTSTQGKHACLVLRSRHWGSVTCAVFAGMPDEQASPDISRLAPHLQQEWDHAANAYLGRIIVVPQSHRKVWWRSGTCKTGQPHRWQASMQHRTRGTKCPYDTGRAVCPCNNVAHNHPEVAAEWDWDANGERTPETVTANSNTKAAWRCALCGHKWSVIISHRTRGTGCPQCAREASRHKTRQPSISDGAPDLLAEWDWEANATHGWHPDQITMGSMKKVHWVQREECKLGLVHRWQASPQKRTSKHKGGSPFPSGKSVCACNSLAVQCPEAADLWDHKANGRLTPDNVTVGSHQVVYWRAPDGMQWQQIVYKVVIIARRQRISRDYY